MSCSGTIWNTGRFPLINGAYNSLSKHRIEILI